MRALLALLAITSVATATPPPEIASVTLERKGCYGRCAVYSLEVRRDGTVIYRGTRFVATVGERSSKISTESFQQIVSKIQAVKFFELSGPFVFKNPMGPLNIDGPSSTITV